MVQDVNMGEILGPIVLAVVINVSSSPFSQIHRAHRPPQSRSCMGPELCSGTTTTQRVTTTLFSPGQSRFKSAHLTGLIGSAHMPLSQTSRLLVHDLGHIPRRSLYIHALGPH